MARPRKDGPQIDWSAIYADWVTGDYSNQALSRRYGVSAMSIGRKVKADGWSTTSGPVVNPVLTEDAEPETPPRRKADKDDTKGATTSALLKRSRLLAKRLLAEVEDITTYEGEIADIIVTEESDPIRRRAALKAISVGERIRMLKDLTATLNQTEAQNKAAKSATVAAEDKPPEGKKAQRQAEAEKSAASGVFAVPSAPPRLVASK
jgi:uncharacterized protein YjcR